MPLLQKMSIRVPLVTNFPASKKMRPQDSALLKDVKELTTFISNDPFWNAQVAQIDIVGDKNFELIPTLGNHVIRIGSADALEEKLNRLFVFYKNVLSKTGFDHYSVIDVQYKDQVVATQKGTVSKVDALQLQKNIEELMKKAQQAQEAQQPMVIDSTNQLQTNNSHEAFDTAQAKESIEKPDLPNPSSISETTTTKPGPTLKKSTVKPKPTVKKKEVKKPKAVMRPT
jgi:cell division protein FtsQ